MLQLSHTIDSESEVDVIRSRSTGPTVTSWRGVWLQKLPTWSMLEKTLNHGGSYIIEAFNMFPRHCSHNQLCDLFASS